MHLSAVKAGFLHLSVKGQKKKLCGLMIWLTGLIKCEYAPLEPVYIAPCSAICVFPSLLQSYGFKRERDFTQAAFVLVISEFLWHSNTAQIKTFEFSTLLSKSILLLNATTGKTKLLIYCFYMNYCSTFGVRSILEMVDKLFISMQCFSC